MSAIRPPIFSPLFTAQTPPPSPVRASRSDFFRAALDGVNAAAGTTPAGPSAERVTTAQAARATDDRLQRPGALLDIRV